MKTIIMCGGAGTRLWPISTEDNPKQFLQIFNGESLFEKTIRRNLNKTEEFIIVVNEKQFPICKKQTDSFDAKFIFLIEPIAKNTAAAISLASLFARPDDNLLVVPSDHLIFDEEKYKLSISHAIKSAENNKLVTFGIRPSYPETGFGYIEYDKSLKEHTSKVISFKEKPDLSTATDYLEKGNFLWNSGMFIFKAKTYLQELCEHSNEIFTSISDVFKNKIADNNIINFERDLMEKVPSNSIDYAVMEKSQVVDVVPSSFRWSDLGSYDSLYNELPKDEDGNTKDPNLSQYNSKNNLIISESRKVALFDVEDLIIVDSKDAILVGKRGKSQNVKKIKK